MSIDQRSGKIAFQGEAGANSDTASREKYPNMTPVACDTFEDVFAALDKGAVDLAMIPIENSVAGRVADIHHLLPHSNAYIIDEYFLPIHFQLMAKKGTTLGFHQNCLQPYSCSRPVPQNYQKKRLESS